uniref:Uncharacterized protein n=1 Tax=Romanomermis culicivorax TaxID=13658 RepID=A0A915INX2_ROMCU
MTHGNLQPNRTERKFPVRSITLCRFHSGSFGKVLSRSPEAPGNLIIYSLTLCCNGETTEECCNVEQDLLWPTF